MKNEKISNPQLKLQRIINYLKKTGLGMSDSAAIAYSFEAGISAVIMAITSAFLFIFSHALLPLDLITPLFFPILVFSLALIALNGVTDFMFVGAKPISTLHSLAAVLFILAAAATAIAGFMGMGLSFPVIMQVFSIGSLSLCALKIFDFLFENFLTQLYRESLITLLEKDLNEIPIHNANSSFYVFKLVISHIAEITVGKLSSWQNSLFKWCNDLQASFHKRLWGEPNKIIFKDPKTQQALSFKKVDFPMQKAGVTRALRFNRLNADRSDILNNSIFYSAELTRAREVSADRNSFKHSRQKAGKS